MSNSSESGSGKRTRQTSRRRFLATTALASAAAPLGAAGSSLAQASQPSSSASGANERIVVGVIGTGSQGRGDMMAFLRNKEVEVATICDVNEAQLKRTLALLEKKPEIHRDFRRLLERKDIDAVIVATPDHWHALSTIYACQAGKDVYVEKPLALTIQEGRRMVEIARATNRVVQVGTQQRSGRHFQRAVELVRQGRLGKISLVRTWTHENQYPEGIGNPPDADPPSGLDWDMWLGPAPYHAWNPNRTSLDFRWFWDYSGGKLTDWGTHLIDIVQWAMDVDAPAWISAHGGKFYLQDNRETPDTLEVLYEYPGFLLAYSSRECNSRPVENKSYGIEFFGSDGSLFVDREGFELYPETKRVQSDEYTFRAPYMRGRGSEQHAAHVRNFLDCVKSRQRPISDVEIGHRSTTTSHLGNIAFKTHSRLHWDPATESFRDAPQEAVALLSKEYRKPWVLP